MLVGNAAPPLLPRGQERVRLIDEQHTAMH